MTKFFLQIPLSTVSLWEKRIGLGRRSRLQTPGPPWAYAVRVPGRVGVGVVEGVDRIGWRNLKLKTRAGRQVADGKPHSVDLAVPKEENFDRPAQPLGQFSSRRAHAFVDCRPRSVVVCDFARHWSPFRSS
jgi:hypothetical protein